MPFDPSQPSEPVESTQAGFDASAPSEPVADQGSDWKHWQGVFAGQKAASEMLEAGRRQHVDSITSKMPDPQEGFFEAANRAFVRSRSPLFKDVDPAIDWAGVNLAYAKAELGVNKPDISATDLYSTIRQNMENGNLQAVELARRVHAVKSPMDGLRLVFDWLHTYGPEAAKQKAGEFNKQALSLPKFAVEKPSLPDIEETPDIFGKPNSNGFKNTVHDPSVIKSIYNSTAGAVESFTTPENAALIAVTGGAGALRNSYKIANLGLEGMKLTFTGLMAKQAYDSSEEAKRILADVHSTRGERIQAITDSVVSDTMALSMTMLMAKDSMNSQQSKALDEFKKGKTPEEVASYLNEMAKLATPEEAPAIQNAAKEMEKIAPPPAEPGSKGPAPAKFIGVQEGVPGVVPDIELYNLTQDIDGHPVDSTVSRQTLERKGYSIPPMEKTAPVSATPEVKVTALSADPAKVLAQVESGKSIGIKNASVDEELKAMGVDPAEHGAKVTRQGLLDDAMGKIKEDPQVGQKLIATLETRTEPATAKEGVLLAVETNRLRLARDSAQSELIEARKAGDAERVSAAELRVAQTRDDFVRAEQLSTKVGTSNAQALAMRAVMLKEDYSLAKLESDRMAANPKGELTPEAAKEVAELHQKLQEAEKKYADYKARASELLMNDEYKGRTPGRGAPPGKVMSFISEQAKAARSRIAARMAEGRLQAGLDPIDLADHVIVGAEYFAKGVSKFGDWSKEMVKEFGDKLTPHLAAIFDAAKEQVTNHRRLIAAESAADRQIAHLEEQIKNDAPFSDSRTKGPTNAAIEAKRARVAELQDIRDNIRDALQPKDPVTREEITHTGRKTRMENRIKELEKKVAENDFGPKPKKEAVPFDPVEQKLQADIERVKKLVDLGRMRDELQNRTPLQKTTNAFVQWVRIGALSWPTVIAKLTGAAIIRVITTPIEQGVGFGISKLLPELASKAPREGVPSAGGALRAEGKAITEGITTGMKGAWDMLHNRDSVESALLEKTHLPPGIADYIGKIHGALKQPTKINEFARSLELRVQHALRNGLDPRDPVLQMRLMHESWMDANRAIFMQDNFLVDAYKRAVGALEKADPKKYGETGAAAAKLIATGIQTELPIVKVPTNVIFEASQILTGWLTGPAKAAWEYAHGIENLKPVEADSIMRLMKKGSIGLALTALGFYKYKQLGGFYEKGEKRRQSDLQPGEIKAGGVTIPSQLTHNPYVSDALQFGATMGRVMNRSNHSDESGWGSALIAATMGVVEETPFLRESTTIGRYLDPKQQSRALSEKASSILVPGAVQWLARQTDKTTPFNFTQNPVKRKPANFKETIETKIPVLRQNVKRDPNTSYRK